VRYPFALLLGCALLALAAWWLVVGFGGAAKTESVRVAMETVAQLVRVHGVEDLDRVTEERVRVFLAGLEGIDLRGLPEGFAVAFRAWRDEWRQVLRVLPAPGGVPVELRIRLDKAKERLRAGAARHLRGTALRRPRDSGADRPELLQGCGCGTVAGLKPDGGFEMAERGGIVAAAIADQAESVGGVGIA
jgi:hypothetical protein